jgi:hypothetical protein
MYPQNTRTKIFDLIFCWYFADICCIRNISTDKYFARTPVVGLEVEYNKKPIQLSQRGTLNFWLHPNTTVTVTLGSVA